MGLGLACMHSCVKQLRWDAFVDLSFFLDFLSVRRFCDLRFSGFPGVGKQNTLAQHVKLSSCLAIFLA